MLPSQAQRPASADPAAGFQWIAIVQLAFTCSMVNDTLELPCRFAGQRAVPAPAEPRASLRMQMSVTASPPRSMLPAQRCDLGVS